jgi:acetyltransferase-like isoleucine patch superfamily enzyme
MHASVLRAVHAWDRIHLAWFLRRWRHAVQADGEISPHLRFAQLRVEPGGRLVIGEGFATERQAGNHFWIGEDAQVEFGPRAWLRTEHGANRITAFAGARVRVGRDALINGAMLHAKAGISIGDESRIAFGARILDADLHDLDSATREQVAPVKIGDRVWLGADAIVLRGVTIGDDVVVGAGSVVTRDLPPRCLALGSPARPVREIAPRTDCG